MNRLVILGIFVGLQGYAGLVRGQPTISSVNAAANVPTASPSIDPAKEFGLPEYAARPWLREDATLHGVAFYDADRGWAVGDRGVILHSRSGGDTWTPQPTPTLASLRAVDFVDSQNGVAVGGYYEPETGISRGVLLVTRDGGERWIRVYADLPFLRDVRANADKSLVVAGDFSPVHGGSVLSSDDGGRTWIAVVTENIPRAAHLAGGPTERLNVLGVDGVVNHFSSVLQSARPTLADAGLAAIAGSETFVAVGSDRSVRFSKDGGRTWSLDNGLQNAALQPRHAHTDRTQTTIVGMPGSLIARTDANAEDGTNRFLQTSSPIHAPLHAVTFVDAQRGWAVGAFGTILATRDGGRQWRIQHGGDHRAALLVIGQSAADVPWLVVANEALEQGRRVVVGTANQPISNDPLTPDADDLLRQIATNLGGGEMFRWNERREGSPMPDDNLRRVLEAYRPRVILFSDAVDSDDRRRWIEIASEKGVQRVLEPTGKSYSEWSVHRRALLPRTGALLSDLSRDARALANAGDAESDELYYRRTFDAMLPLGRPIKGPLDGYIDNSRDDTRAVPNTASRRSLQVLQARAGEDQMIRRMLADGDRNGSFIQRLRLTLSRTPDENRERLAREILRGCRQTDQPRLYQQALSVVASQLNGQPLGRLASLQNDALTQSVEWNGSIRLLPSLEPPAVANATDVRFSPFEQAPDANPLRSSPQAIRQASSVGELVVAPEYTPEPTPLFSAGSRPDLAWDMAPQVALVRQRPLATLRAVDAPPQLGVLKQMATHPDTRDWGRLANPTAAIAIPLHRTSERPFLDGRLDEACWQATPGQLVASGYRLRMAYDGQHIYWAVRGPVPKSVPANHAAERTRDADLNAEPRLMLRIDLDGDLMTAFGFEVDVHGRTRDTCNGFAGWQPMWFVDSRVEAGQWTVEAAVRRSDLSHLPPTVGSTWNVRLSSVAKDWDGWAEPLPSSDAWHVARFE